MTLRIRVSVTEVDGLRYYMDNDNADLAKTLAELRREAEPSDPLLRGRAFHKVLEELRDTEETVIDDGDGYVFDFSKIDMTLPLGDIREVKTEHLMHIGDIEVCLVGKVDVLEGLIIQDHKYTKEFVPDRYPSSFQGKAYLDMFGCNQMIWNVFIGNEKVGKDGKHYCQVRDLHQISTYRYTGMEDDVRDGVREFVEFARIHLPERFIREEEEA